MRTYRIYGNSDLSSEGFPTEASIRDYIRGGIFTENRGRYRYSQKTFANTIILSYKGVAHGHFDITRAVEPTAEDITAFSKTAQVFLVKQATIYERPVRLYDNATPEDGTSSLRYRVGHSGLPVAEEDFTKIIGKAGKTKSIPAEVTDQR